MNPLLRLTMGLCALQLAVHALPVNPVRSGLPPYGLRDPHLTRGHDAWNLVATEVRAPGAPAPDLHRFTSTDLAHWATAEVLVAHADVPADAWYHDAWGSPELHEIKGKRWLVWHARNQTADPYGPTGIVLACAPSAGAHFKVVTPVAPLARGANPTLWTDRAGQTHLVFDRDGTLWTSPVDLEAARLLASPTPILPVPVGLHRLCVAPALVEHDGILHLFYSTFGGGYHIQHATARALTGPWRTDGAPVFSWSEDDCDQTLRNAYPADHPFVPPIEITGKASVFAGPDGQPCFAYHSPDKYAEPSLCLDPLSFAADGAIAFQGRTWLGQPAGQHPHLSFAADIPAAIPTSPFYSASVEAPSEQQSVTVYHARATWRTNQCEDTGWFRFTCSKPVTVRVTRHGFAPITYCAILPRSRGIVPRIVSSDTVEFTVDRPGQLSVEFQRGLHLEHPLLVFADPPENYDLGSADVIRIPPGLHEVAEPIQLRTGQTLYLAPGAWLRAQVRAEHADHVRVIGRGVLDGIRYPARGGSHMIMFRDVADAVVDGITIVNAPRFNVAIDGPRATVRNVKMLGWWFSTDGVATGRNGLIEDCFFKVNDDAIKLYHSGTEARRCVIWQMENGAPFMLSWNIGDDNAGFYAHDIDVIRVEHAWDNPNLAIFAAIHGSGGNMSDYRFEHIRVDNCDWRLFHLVTRPNHFAPWNPAGGSLSKLVFNDIEFAGVPRIPSLIRGWDEHHLVSDVSIHNLRIAGQPVSGLDPRFFQIDRATTRNIEITP